MRLFLSLAFLLSCVLVDTLAHKNFILLIAGSNTYDNYRHQADICHAYQIFHKNGIPDEQIVVMMYDDIANNNLNPMKGKIINRPNGSDVYHGVPKDYTGADVNSKVFLAVLQGDKAQVKKLTGKDGKVIESGPNDHIFVYYADHGATGLVCMPTGGFLYAKPLNKVLQDMHKKKQFAKLTFYMEACESGSMFDKLLPKNINVYAVTAANPKESSYGCYCFLPKMETCLGDTFSISWMEDTDASDVNTETFETQFQRVYKRTRNGTKEQHPGSHPQQYGDTTFTSSSLSMFMAKSKDSHTLTFQKEHDRREEPLDAIPSDMIGKVLLKRQIASLPVGSALLPELEKKLNEMLLTEKHTHDAFVQIVQTVLGEDDEDIFDDHQDISDFDCYQSAVDLFVKSCPKLDTNTNTLFLRTLRVLVNLCNHQPTDRILFAVISATERSPLCY